jgi:hypothetical protein
MQSGWATGGQGGAMGHLPAQLRAGCTDCSDGQVLVAFCTSLEHQGRTAWCDHDL